MAGKSERIFCRLRIKFHQFGVENSTVYFCFSRIIPNVQKRLRKYSGVCFLSCKLHIPTVPPWIKQGLNTKFLKKFALRRTMHDRRIKSYPLEMVYVGVFYRKSNMSLLAPWIYHHVLSFGALFWGIKLSRILFMLEATKYIFFTFLHIA